MVAQPTQNKLTSFAKAKQSLPWASTLRLPTCTLAPNYCNIPSWHTLTCTCTEAGTVHTSIAHFMCLKCSLRRLHTNVPFNGGWSPKVKDHQYRTPQQQLIEKTCKYIMDFCCTSGRHLGWVTSYYIVSYQEEAKVSAPVNVNSTVQSPRSTSRKDYIFNTPPY